MNQSEVALNNERVFVYGIRKSVVYVLSTFLIVFGIPLFTRGNDNGYLCLSIAFLLLFLLFYLKKEIRIGEKDVSIPKGIFDKNTYRFNKSEIRSIKLETIGLGKLARNYVSIKLNNYSVVRVNIMKLSGEDHFEIIELLNPNKSQSSLLTNWTEEKIKYRWVTRVLITGASFFPIMIYCSLFSFHGMAEMEKIYIYSGLITISLYFYFVLTAPQFKKVNFLVRFLVPIFSLCFFYIGLHLALTTINVSLDKSIGVKTISHLTTDIGGQFRVAHWKTGDPIVTGDSQFRKENRYEGIPVEFMLHPGSLGASWMSDIRVIEDQ